MNQWLKIIFEIGPLLVFFFANAKWGILDATLAFILATAISLGASYAMLRKIPIMPLCTGIFVMIFGGLTVWLEDELFIKLKPTIVNIVFAVVLYIGLFSKRLFIKTLLQPAIQLTNAGWLILTRAWICFFLVLAFLNELVWRNFSTDIWVNFKVFGILPLTLVFTFALVPVLTKYTLHLPKSSQTGRRTDD